MAEGGSRQGWFKDSFGKASGDADEAFCDPCKSEGKWVAVEGYCQVCDEYVCENCLGVHRKQKITKGHAILGKTCLPTRLGSPSTNDLCVDVCKTHHPEIIKYYCKAHDVPGCGDCMTLNHQTCERKRIQDISDGYEKTQELKHIDQKLQQLYQDLKSIDFNRSQKNLDKTYDNILKKIKAARKQVNDNLDQMEKQVTDKAAQMKKEDSAELNKYIAESQNIRKELENMLGAIHKSNANVNTLFVTTKQAKQRLATMYREINSIKEKQQEQLQYEFQISNEIHQIVSTKTPIGELSRKSNGITQPVKSNPANKETTNPANIATANRARRGHSKSTPVTKVTTTHNCSINVKCREDKHTCGISDSTIINKDMLVITDIKNNKKVKVIDTSKNTVITSYTTPGVMWGVTALSTDMIAVTLPAERKILLLKVTSSSITKHSEIKVSGECRGIAHKDGKLAVSYCDPGRVEILDIQGKVLHEIKPQYTSDELKWPEYILFGRDRGTLIVSDSGTHKVCVITFSGQILHTYTHDALKNPKGIFMTEDGLLFVCSWLNGCIHVISEDFKSSKVIIKQDKHVEHPQSITYCDNKHRLYISNCSFLANDMDMNNLIQVYDFKV